MWYEKRWMKVLFYFGVMFSFVGIGLTRIDPGLRVFGVVSLCVGIALIIFGFTGIMLNLLVEMKVSERNTRSSRPRT